MVVIAVGTTNTAKIQSVKLAIKRISTVCPEFENFQVIGCGVSTTVSKQPMSDQESLDGATQRALGALLLNSDADYGIGIESGLQDIGSLWFESGWVVCVSKAGQKGIASSDRYEIRPHIVELIRSGLELSDAIEQVLGVEKVRTGSGFSGLITNNLINRTDSYVNAVILSFGPHISNRSIWNNKADYS